MIKNDQTWPRTSYIHHSWKLRGNFTTRQGGVATHPMSWVCSKRVNSKIRRNSIVSLSPCILFWNGIWTNPYHENIRKWELSAGYQTHCSVCDDPQNSWITLVTATPGNRSHWVPWILNKHECRALRHMWGARTLWVSTTPWKPGNSTGCYRKIIVSSG